MNRYRSTMLVAGLLAAAALPQAVSAEDAAVGNLAGDVDLTVADVATGGVADHARPRPPRSPRPSTPTRSAPVLLRVRAERQPDPSARRPSSLGANLDPRQMTADLPGLEPGHDLRLPDRRVGPPRRPLGRPGPLVPDGPAASRLQEGRSRAARSAAPRRDDVLRGTRKRDVICGLGGRDKIRGLGGNDVIRGGARQRQHARRSGQGPGLRQRRKRHTATDRAAATVSTAARAATGSSAAPGRDSAKIDRHDKVRSVEKASRR